MAIVTNAPRTLALSLPQSHGSLAASALSHGSLAAPSLASLRPHFHTAPSLRRPWLRCVRTFTRLPRCAVPGFAASALSHGSLAAPSLASLRPHFHTAPSLRRPWLRCVRTFTRLPRCAVPGFAASALSQSRTGRRGCARRTIAVRVSRWNNAATCARRSPARALASSGPVAPAPSPTRSARPCPSSSPTPRAGSSRTSTATA